MKSKQHYEEQAKYFKSLSPEDQMIYLMANKSDLVITLDNDNTTIVFKEDSDIDGMMSLKNDFGNRSGVMTLLKHLGFEVEYC